jgi:hypothetical protein
LIGGAAASLFLCGIALVALLVALAVLSDEGGSDPEPTAISNLGVPTVVINAPTAGQSFSTGSKITVNALASDAGPGITRVDLLVNNVVVDSQPSQNPAGDKSLAVLLDYTAAVPMPNLTLTVRAYRGVTVGTDASVNVVVAAASASTATPSSGSNTTNPVPPVQPTFNPVCRARVDVATLNLRQGPGTGFAVVATLNIGAEPSVVGRLADNSWWNVTSGNNRGWISATFTTLLGTCNNVPITTPPASPTPAVTATATGTQAPTTANLIVSTLSGANNILLTGGEVAASYIVKVRNTGGTATGAFNVSITYPDGTFFDYTIASLAAGQEVEVPNVTAKFTTPGSYRLQVFVDSSGNITESNKGDNLAVLDIVVGAPTPTPE